MIWQLVSPPIDNDRSSQSGIAVVKKARQELSNTTLAYAAATASGKKISKLDEIGK